MSEAAVVRDQPSTAVAVTPMAMLQLAVEKGASVEQLERLMALQERYEANEAKKEFVIAMTAFKEHPLVIEKNKLVDFTGNSGKRTHYKHATLANVCDTIRHRNRYAIVHRRLPLSVSDCRFTGQNHPDLIHA